MGYPIKRETKNGTRYTAMANIGPGGKPVSVGTFASKTKAKKAWEDAESDKRNGRGVEVRGGQMKFRTFCEQVWIPNKKADWSVNTRAGYERKLSAHIYAKFGDVPLARIDAAMIDGWLAKLAADGQSPANRGAILVVLRAALNKAVKYRYIPYNPVSSVDKPKGEKPEWNVMAEEDANKILDAMVAWAEEPAVPNKGRIGSAQQPIAPIYQVMMVLEMSLGARYSEWAGLTRGSFNPLNNTVTIAETVHELTVEKLDAYCAEGLPYGNRRIGPRHYIAPFPKNKKPRVIPIDKEVMDLVIDYLNSKGIVEADQLAFVTAAGLPVGSKTMRKVWKELLRRADVGDMRIHDIRHTVATWLHEGGLNLREVMEIMGHAQLSTTQLYQHVRRSEKFDDRVRAAVTRGKFGAAAAAARAQKAEGK